jgi:hypothetical protein
MIMKKGLDAQFVHYGIRRDDMRLIEALCGQHGIDFDWLKEDVLKRYHEERIQQGDGFGEKQVEKLVEKAVGKIK